MTTSITRPPFGPGFFFSCEWPEPDAKAGRANVRSDRNVRAMDFMVLVLVVVGLLVLFVC